ncbi:helix-turn-helix domain-containing protein [Splendidivirga corallicola]|uniref:helix-turn-helix domain-containing protein n=1 Tax=Splendidivirga corallicola TaxID=3051826 RepID=UPI003D2CB90F
MAWWILSYAKKLLRKTDLSLPDIAEKTGYASEVSFSQVFKKKFNLTPENLERFPKMLMIVIDLNCLFH